MPKFAKKIELDDTLKDVFFSFLLNGKYRVPTLVQKQEKLISYISEQFLISGFILKACSFNLSHKSLVEQIKYQRKIQLAKQMLVKNDLNNIARNLNDKCIEHVFLKGVALNSDGIYSSGVRFSRDIDLLVRLDQLDQAYNVLKTLGFRYLNPKTRDSTKYHYFGHHLPEMINENNIKLELHWRVTPSRRLKDCPLADKMLDSRRVSNTNSHVFCPKIEMMIAHIIYHSFEQHHTNLGPIFLFDLAAIYHYFGNDWPVDRELFIELGIEKKFDLCKQFIEGASNEFKLSAKSKFLRDQIFTNSQWLRLSRGSSISGSFVKTICIKIFDNRNVLSNVMLKFRATRTQYQVSYYSPKFWSVLVSDILNFFKRVLFSFLN